MKHRATYLTFTALIFVLLLSSSKVQAQTSLGVIIDGSEQTALNAREFEFFEELGVSHIEVVRPSNSQLLDVLRDYDFTIYVNLGYRFLTLDELTENKTQLIESYSSLLDELQVYTNIYSIGLLENSQMHNAEFEANFKEILGELQEQTNLTFYYTQNGLRFYFENTEQIIGQTFQDEDFELNDLHSFDNKYSELVSLANFEQILFVHSDWLFQAIEEYPPFRESLTIYHATGNWVFPNPQTDPKSQSISFHWIIIVLLFLWVLLAAQVKYLPYTRPMILRYFFAHRFYVDDIIQYRERNAVAGLSLIFSHALFGGIVFYVLGNILLSQNGLQALYHHYPILSAFGDRYMSLFFTGSICVLGLELLALLWLHLPAKNLQSISQTINLYSGIFFINYLLITLAVTLFIQETNYSNFLLTLCIIYFIIWYASFNITAINISKNMGGNRFIYLTLTIGLHTVISAVFLFLILSTDSLMEILHLSISL